MSAADAMIEAAVRRLPRDPPRTALLLDFDGSLAPIVLAPGRCGAAVAGHGGRARDDRAGICGLVAIVSGRPVDFLVRCAPGARRAPRRPVRAGMGGRRRRWSSTSGRSRTSPRSLPRPTEARAPLARVLIERKGESRSRCTGATAPHRRAPGRRARSRRSARGWASPCTPAAWPASCARRSRSTRAARSSALVDGCSDGRVRGRRLGRPPRVRGARPAAGRRPPRRASCGSRSRRRKRRPRCSPRPMSSSTAPRACARLLDALDDARAGRSLSRDGRRSGVREQVGEPGRAACGRRQRAQPPGAVRPVRRAASPARRRARRPSARCRTGAPARPRTPSSSNAPASRDRHTTPSRAVEQRPFLGDEVQPVLQRVHEQHVVPLQPGDAAGEVVAQVEHDRDQSRVPNRSLTRCDVLLDLVLVREVLGQAGARHVEPSRRTRRARAAPGRASSSRSYARNPRTMFFDGSTRSVRNTTSRSPTSSSSRFAASCASGDRGDLFERGGVGPEARREPRRRTLGAEHVARPTPRRRRPNAACGTRRAHTSASGTTSRRRRRGGCGSPPGRRTGCA